LQSSTHCANCNGRTTRKNSSTTGEAQQQLGGGESAFTEHNIRGPQGDCSKSRCGAVELMPNYRPEAIANEFLRRRSDDTWPSQVILHKLTYLAHGWNLAINNEPLVVDRPEAWDGGPVFRRIWDHIKKYGYRGKNCALINPETDEEYAVQLTAEEAAVVDHVWRKYGHMTPRELSDMTHEPGTPWSNAYLKRRNEVISNIDIKKHYVRLALAGRTAAAG